MSKASTPSATDPALLYQLHTDPHSLIPWRPAAGNLFGQIIHTSQKNMKYSALKNKVITKTTTSPLYLVLYT